MPHYTRRRATSECIPHQPLALCLLLHKCVHTCTHTNTTYLGTCMHHAYIYKTQPKLLSCLPLDIQSSLWPTSAGPDAGSASDLLPGDREKEYLRDQNQNVSPMVLTSYSENLWCRCLQLGKLFHLDSYLLSLERR